LSGHELRLRVKDCDPGAIIETLTAAGVPSGNVYRLAKYERANDKRIAYRRFTLERVFLHPYNWCRILDYSLIDGFPYDC
jgi:hypothetical protein